ncbi:MAG: NUDIX domain-containing protein [bacterium]
METHVITTAIIRNQNKFLIAKRSATKKFAPNQWEFVSGFIDTIESPAETIIREIKEELGVKGKVIGASDPVDIVDREGKWTIIPFLIELDRQEIQTNSEDHSEAKWVDVEELNDYPDLKPFLDSEGIQKLLNIKQ